MSSDRKKFLRNTHNLKLIISFDYLSKSVTIELCFVHKKNISIKRYNDDIQ